MPLIVLWVANCTFLKCSIRLEDKSSSRASNSHPSQFIVRRSTSNTPTPSLSMNSVVLVTYSGVFPEAPENLLVAHALLPSTFTKMTSLRVPRPRLTTVTLENRQKMYIELQGIAYFVGIFCNRQRKIKVKRSCNFTSINFLRL